MIVDNEDQVNAFLEHHGILGMKWGVRNEKKQAKREQKAQKFVIEADRLQTKISELNKKASQSRFRKRHFNKEIDKLSKDRQTAIDAAEAKRQGKLTKKQKHVLIGAGVVGGILAAYGTYKLAESGQLRSAITKGKMFVTKETGPPWKIDSKLASKELGSEGLLEFVAKKVNPDYGTPGSVSNCRRCTFAYEMRRRGFDVSATRTTSGIGGDFAGIRNATTPDKKLLPTSKSRQVFNVIKEAIRDPKNLVDTPFEEAHNTFLHGIGKHIIVPEGDSLAPSIFKTLAKHPNGARGELGVIWSSGGGHSIAWEIVKGEPVLFDTQLGKKIVSPKELIDLYGDHFKSAGFTRLDDVPLNHDFLLRWLKNAKS